jgi:hypothetical protein
MFPELRNYLDELESTAESTGVFLRKLNGGRRRNLNAIANAEAQIKLMRNETKFVASLKPQIQRDTLELSKTILFNEARSALRTNKEFDDEVYRLPLFEAIESNDTYTVRMQGAGFSSTVSVDINLDKSAGRLNMWAAAIKAVRDELGVVIPRKDSKVYRKKAIAASMAWKRLYESGAYTETVEQRLQASAKIAPFWSILNFGTTKLSSDRGGFATPKNRPTNFLHKAEQEIKSAIAGLFTTAKEKYQSAFAEYNAFLEDSRERQLRLDEMANEIRIDLQTVRKLEREYEIDSQEIDRNKLEKAVLEVRKRLTNKKIFDIGAKGSRKRISRGTIERFYL